MYTSLQRVTFMWGMLFTSLDTSVLIHVAPLHPLNISFVFKLEKAKGVWGWGLEVQEQVRESKWVEGIKVFSSKVRGGTGETQSYENNTLWNSKLKHIFQKYFSFLSWPNILWPY